ncbi:iron-containing alcohol dehydrogenase [Aneurinibacillus sp. Ricciae_BoGa-3]|uniref:iron-containing alcohol dehydrogenase n=1 Tax=Aneurinibacillus sp. Ricciae_BoGa-3 TaxID=3022697 RepID=UPI0023425F42|nr:iron-containing alcohol dehydrogenase [Aneurinibacillus sp. Ricciae_BoGa-3]WCK52710.1 iron-containing alcohol dehydrogenase [Aneurinibacillus sp. Ricciae_BoGa-3]
MLNFSLSMPTAIRFGKGEVNQVGEIVAEYAKKVLLVTGRSSTKKTGSLNKVTSSLDKAGVAYVLFDRIEPNPRATTIDEAGRIAKEENCELILALGGGSAMDAAKAIATVALSGRPIHEYIRGNKTGKWKELLPIKEALPIITVPTLAATGSEANSGAVITNWETKEKSGIGGPALFPKVAILDPELTYTVPANYTADGAADMFTHLYEGYMTGDENANVQDEITEGLMRNAIIYAPKAVANPENYDARAHLLWTSTLALIGLANAGRGGTFPVHAIEHTLSAHYDISHGRGLAILTPAYFELVVKQDRPHRLARLGRNVFRIQEDNDDKAANETIKALIHWYKEIGSYGTLSELGIKREDLRMMAEETVRVSGVDGYLNATRKLSADDILKIYEACFE